MKHFLALILSISVIAGCKPAHDPAKWYLTEYENKRFIFEHDHKRYTAECFQSFGVGKKTPDSTPDCTDILTIPGIGHEISEKRRLKFVGSPQEPTRYTLLRAMKDLNFSSRSSA